MQALVTVVVPIERGCDNTVLVKLQALGNPAVAPVRSAIASLGNVHYLSMSVVPALAGGRAHLLMEGSVDGEPTAALRRLSVTLGPWLQDILAAAGVSACQLLDLPTLIGRHSYSLGASWWETASSSGALGLGFCGSPMLGLDRIRSEEALAALIAGMTDLLGGPLSSWRKLAEVREILWHRADAKWAFAPQPAPFLSARRISEQRVYSEVAAASFTSLLWPWLLIVAAIVIAAKLAGLAFLASIPLGIGATALAGGSGWLYLRHLEATDVPDDVAPDPNLVERVMDGENHVGQNLMVLVSTVKPGRFRRLTLRIALWLTGQFISRRGTPGFLGGVGVVHFARWILLPGTNQFVFISNYDGSWSSYLEDFINLVPYGVTGIWSNCQGFPRAEGLFNKGATDGDRFQQWARRQQIPAAFWYAAYPDLTLERIRANAQICRGLATAETDKDAQTWLALFGAPSP